MGKANRYDEFTVQEQENGPPLILDRHGRERPSTKVERALWEILNRDDDKARIAILKDRVAELEQRIANMTKCDCGTVLSRHCPTCDRDE